MDGVLIAVLGLAGASLASLLGGIIAMARTRLPPNEQSQEHRDGDAGARMRELKRLVRAGKWRLALPSLLVIGGLLGVMLFGSIALLLGLEQNLTGLTMLAVAIYAAARVATDYTRA